MKYADKIGAAYTVVLGDAELESRRVNLKNMRDGTQTELDLDDFCRRVPVHRPSRGARGVGYIGLRRGGYFCDFRGRAKLMDTMQGIKRTDYCGTLRASDIGREVTVCGWVQKQRDLGALIFVDLRDRTGILQLAFTESTDPAVMEKAGDASLGIRRRGKGRFA